MSDLVRSNKVTAYWGGDGIAIGQFYRTHEKIMTVKSDDAAVVNAGFVFPEGTEEAPVTAQQKLEAFKTFLMTNASIFNIQYDPVDRRDDAFKFPNRYDDENIKEYSRKMLDNAVGAAVEKVRNNVIANMIKAGNLAEGTTLEFGVGDPAVDITERYNNNGIKYGTVTYPVAFAVNGQQAETECAVQLVSGQLKKPRELKDAALTMTGLKTFLIDAGLLPKIEKPSKDADADAEAKEDTADTTEAGADGEKKPKRRVAKKDAE